ncbi:MAG: hypothetical protein MUC98_04895 [Desulfobacterota bacterium]|nr:hypothetical protein [Thermodesulfobacteriota bacterium]
MKRSPRLFRTLERPRGLPLGRVLLFFWTAGILVLTGTNGVFAETYIQSLERGKVDWTNGIVEVSATGMPPAHALSPAQGRALAETEAETLARGELIGLLQAIRVDSKSTVKEVLDQQRAGDQLVAAVLRDSHVVEKSVSPNGAVRLMVAMKLNGPFGDLVLPKTIASIQAVEQSQKKEEPFTGLIVDCRGIPLSPAMAPMIIGEDGQVVYGTAHVSRDQALERGVAAYARGLAKSRDNPRVGLKPLIVKGLRAAKGRPCDIVISNADAGKIKGAGSNLSFLHRGKVLFVME